MVQGFGMLTLGLAAAVYLASGYYWKIAVVTVVSAGFISAGIVISRKESSQPLEPGFPD